MPVPSVLHAPEAQGGLPLAPTQAQPSPQAYVPWHPRSLDAGLAEIEIKGSTTACMLSVSPDGRVD